MAIPTPLIWYNFNESSGNATDSIGGVIATSTSVTYSTGKLNNAAYYNGSAFHTIADSVFPRPTNAISFGGWVYISSTSSFQMMCAKGENAGDTRSFEMRCNGTTTKPEIQMRTGGGSFVQARGNTNLGTGVWKHVIYTRSGTSQFIYVDAVSQTLESNVTQSTDIDYSTDNFWFGQRNGGLRFNGRLDMWGVWNVQLSASEVGELYNSGTGVEHPFPAGSVPSRLLMMGVG